MKDPNKATVRLYSIPDDAFEGADDDVEDNVGAEDEFDGADA